MKKYEMPRVSFGDLLALVFIHLKLSGHIDWSWWWVLSPIIAEAVLTIGVRLFVALRQARDGR